MCILVLFVVLYRLFDDNKFFDFVCIFLEKVWLKILNIFLFGDMNCNFSIVNYLVYGVVNKYKF